MSGKLRIAIIHDFLLKLGGAEKVLLEILKIFPSADIYTLFYSENETKSLFSKYNINCSNLQRDIKFPPRSFKYLLSQLPKAIESFDLSEYDLVISLSNSFAHGVITPPSCLHICYCMSPTRYLYDWKEEYLEENNLLRGVKGPIVRKLLSDIRIWDQTAASRPDHYLAISKCVQDRIKKYYRLESEILYPPIDIKKFNPNFGLPEDYYIIISRLSAYKKIDLAIEVFNETGDSLIIIGTGEDEKRLRRVAKGNIEFLGWQSDESTREYLRYAKALVFPGEEDFGLTPIETMASGRPVIAFRKGGVVETVRDGVDGLFFDQPTKESLLATIQKFDSMMKKFDSHSSRLRSEEFGLERFKNSLLEKINKYAKTS